MATPIFRPWPRCSYRFAFLWRIGYFDQQVTRRSWITPLRMRRIGIGAWIVCLGILGEMERVAGV